MPNKQNPAYAGTRAADLRRWATIQMLQLVTTTLYGHPVWNADSIDDYSEFLRNRSRSSQVLFRGQNSNWPLLPYISRITQRDRIPVIEQELRYAFAKESKPFVGTPPDNEWDALVLAQHHSMATRMLDWTRNPLVALWFAVRKPPTDAEFRPEVWVFDPLPENILADKMQGSPFDIDRTQVFIPSHFHPRIQAQDAATVVFKYIPNFPKGFCELSKNKLLRHRLERIRFPNYKARNIRTQLCRKGYTSFNLFPDLDKTCKRILKELIKRPNKALQAIGAKARLQPER